MNAHLSEPYLAFDTRTHVRIPNHISPAISQNDLAMVQSVPPGGNWKNIPLSIPSRRLEQIRTSYAAGEGSRSTYYGRLHPNNPAYTISTYFNRPGNGCYIHHRQDRLISQREAARLQSFPDSFVFYGNQRSVNQQIGNAVPPLLAYAVALQLGEPAQFVDLFSGAGGLSLGFTWADWKPLTANDLDPTFLRTYSANVHADTVPGDIRRSDVFDEIVGRVKARLHPSNRLFLLGGPPCQGFSTAGDRRSMADDRNSLFTHYIRMLDTLQPHGFVFENVPGILNMLGGEVFGHLCRELEAHSFDVHVWKLRAEHYAIPQRRLRVVLVGVRPSSAKPAQPQSRTVLPSTQASLNGLPPCFSVSDALDDLPALEAGQDGSDRGYLFEPTNAYQKFMRGQLAVGGFLAALGERR